MNGIKKIYIMVIIILNICITSSFAATGTSTTNGLRIRKEPSSNGPVLGSVNNGEKVEVLEKTGDWYKIKVNGIEGYAHSDYIDTVEEVTSSSLSETNSEENPTNNENNATNVTNEETKPEITYPIDSETVSATKLHIVPSVTSSVIMNINAGANLKVNKIINNWSYVSYENKTGWIRSSSLKNNNVLPAESNNGTQEEPPSVEPTSVKGYINVTEAIVRGTPSAYGEVITGLGINKEVTILGEEGDWYKIEYDGAIGYVAKRLISETKVSTSRSTSEPRQADETVTIERKDGYVNVNLANIRKSATTSSGILTTLKLKAKVNIIGEESDFYILDINGGIGYISKKLVSDSLESIAEAKVETNNVQYSAVGTDAGTNIVEYAKKYLGYSYVLGGTSPSGFDCSGFVYYIFSNSGYSIGRSCSSQASSGVAVSKADLQLGDILFFNNNSDGSIGHVGIYIGGGNFIHAANARRGVVTDTINSGYYYTYYYSARRVI